MAYIAHYPLIDNKKDIFGHSDLFLPNSSFIEDGILGTCLKFANSQNTTRRYITIPELGGHKTVSISFWIKFFSDSAYVQWRDIFSFQTANADGEATGLRLEIGSAMEQGKSYINLNVFNNGVWTNDGGFGGVNVNRDEWHHITFVASETYGYVYRDGVRVIAHKKTNPNLLLKDKFVLGDSNDIPFEIFDLQIYNHALSKKEVKKIYQTCVLDYTFSDPMIIYNNIYSGKQANYNSMKVEYNVATDIFKEYGFDTATKFSSDGATKQKWAYSYLLVPKTYENLGLNSEDTVLSVSFYAYASDDIDAPIRLTSEHGTSITERYCSGTMSESNTSNLASSDTGKVVYFHAIVTPSTLADYVDTVYLMFYFNKGQTNQFTKGYVLIAGLTICPIPTEFSHIMPVGITGTINNYGIIRDASGWNNDALTYNIHPPILTTDTNIGKYAYRAQNDGSCVYFPLPLNNKNIQGTVEIRIKLYSTKVYQGIIGCASYGGTGVWISAQTEGNALWYYNGSYYRSDNTKLPLSKFTLNTWHQIVAIWKDKSLSWYFDGNFINTITNEKTFAVSDANKTKMHFGGYYPETGSLSWNTKLDAAYSSIKFYAKYLTAEEIKYNYDEISKFQIDTFGGIHVSALTEEAFTNKSSLPKTKSLVSNSFDEISLQDMQTKMLDDGSVWARIFHHNCTGDVYFSDDEPEHFRDINNPAKYSLLYLLNSDRFKNSDGKYEFLLEYPDNDPGHYNRRKQSSNPCTSTTVSGYEAIHIDRTANSRGGLLLNSGSETTFLKGSTTSVRFYAIGSRIAWSGGIPGYSGSQSCTSVNLYIRIDNLDFFDEIEENSNNAKIFKNIIHSSNFNERGK